VARGVIFDMTACAVPAAESFRCDGACSGRNRGTGARALGGENLKRFSRRRRWWGVGVALEGIQNAAAILPALRAAVEGMNNKSRGII